VTFYAEVTDVGRTSINVHVDVFSERSRNKGEQIKVTQADLVYVAIDEDRKPTPIDKE
jgi:acyl-CoA thioesterase YciA